MAWTTADSSRRSCGRTCSSRNHGHSATTASTESRRRPRLTKLRQTLSSAPFLQPSRRTSWPRRLKPQRRKTAVSHRPESGRTWMWSLKIGAAPERHETVPGHAPRRGGGPLSVCSGRRAPGLLARQDPGWCSSARHGPSYHSEHMRGPERTRSCNCRCPGSACRPRRGPMVRLRLG